MNSTIRSIAAAFVFALLACGGYLVGEHVGEARTREALERDALAQLANTLFLLEEYEKGDLNDVKRLLQASTSGQLETIIEYGNRSAASPHTKFRCSLLLRLKRYREANKLFETADWDYMWKATGVREAEQRRVGFLNTELSTWCPG